MIDFSTVKAINIAEGVVKKIVATGKTLWEAITFTNQVPISTDTDGSIYNKVGYKDDTRLSSSGGVSGSAQSGSATTGFIPCKVYDVIRLKGVAWLGNSTGHYYLNFYDVNKNFLAGFSASSYAGNFDRITSVVYDATSGVTTMQNTSHDTDNWAYIKAIQSAEFIRINAYGKGADMIVTINEEIT